MGRRARHRRSGATQASGAADAALRGELPLGLIAFAREAREAKALDQPASQLERFAASPSRDIRKITASRPSLREHTADELARDNDSSVRAAIAANPACGRRARVRLAGDPDPYVRLAVADNPGTDAATLRRLARDESMVVRAAVAAHPNTDPATAAKLIVDAHRSGRADAIAATAALHPSAVVDTVALLCENAPEMCDTDILAVAEATALIEQ